MLHETSIVCHVTLVLRLHLRYVLVFIVFNKHVIMKQNRTYTESSCLLQYRSIHHGRIINSVLRLQICICFQSMRCSKLFSYSILLRNKVAM